MSAGQVLCFEYQQSLSIIPEKPGWSDSLSISVRMLSEAITSGWYRSQFGKHTSDFVILVGIVMHARPLTGKDLAYLIALGMARPEDEGRLYARVTDIGLAEELGLHRQTVAASADRMAQKGFLSILEIPDRAEGFRDSHGRFGGSKVYLLAGDLQQRFLQKDIQDRAGKTDTVEAFRADNIVPDTSAASSRVGKISTCVDGTTITRDENSDNPAERIDINQKDSEEVDEEENLLSRQILDHFTSAKGLSSYQPSQKEMEALDNLIRDGYSPAEILAGIDSAFQRTQPRYFTLCARVIREQPSWLSSGILPSRRP